MGAGDSRQNEALINNSSINIIPSSIPTIFKSLCKIEYGNSISSGFLIKLFKRTKDFFCLMTNEHVITKEMIKQRRTITLCYDSEAKIKEIDLFPDERFIKDFTDINMDIVVIEIIPKDEISKDYFLIPPIDYMYNYHLLKNKEIIILQYPYGQLSYSVGKIKEINQNEFTHLASIEKGSSGSPIFLKANLRIIGIHQSGTKIMQENFGYFIGPIFQFFKNFGKNNISTENKGENKDEVKTIFSKDIKLNNPNNDDFLNNNILKEDNSKINSPINSEKKEENNLYPKQILSFGVETRTKIVENNCKYLDNELKQKFEIFMEEIKYQESNIFENSNDATYNYFQSQIKKDLIKVLNNNINDYLNEFISLSNNLNPNFNSYISYFNYNIIQNIIKENMELSYQNYIINHLNENLNKEKLINLRHLSIIVVGNTAVGKSTLINCLLKKNNIVNEGLKIIGNKTKKYKNEKFPFLSFIELMGCELGNLFKFFNTERLKEEVFNIIKEEKKYQDFNDKIHCIYFCVHSKYLDKSEIDLLKALKNNTDNIPLIVVFTMAVIKDEVDKMKNEIMSLFPDIKFIPVLGRGYEDIIEPFNLDELLKITIDTVKSNIKNEIFYEIRNKYIEKEKINIQIKILEIKRNIIKEILNEFISNYNLVLTKNNFEEFINYLISKVITEFTLEKKITKNTNLLIQKDINIIQKHIQLFIQLYIETAQKYINMIIEKKSLEYLEMQVKIEREKNSSIMSKNKKTKEDFKDIISKFFQLNFYYNAQKYYIYHFIKDFLELLSIKLADNLFSKMLNFLQSNEMNKYYTNIYLKIFEEYEEKINNEKDCNGKIYC